MKRLLAAIMVAALLLCTGCSKLVVETIDSLTQTEPSNSSVSTTPVPTEQPAVETTPEPAETAEPDPTAEPASEAEPVTVPGKLVYERCAAVLQELKRGDRVEIVEDKGEYCSVKVGETTGLIKKSLLRSDSEGDYQAWGGNTGFNAVLFKNYKLSGSSMTPNLNTAVTVIDEYDDCYVITVGNETYYVSSDCVNWYNVHYWTPESDSGSSGGGSGDSGSSGGSGGGSGDSGSSGGGSGDSGSSGGGSGDSGSSGGSSIDGGDISLTASFGSGYGLTQLKSAATLTSHIPTLLDDTGTVVSTGGNATVKVDGAELILCFIDPGTELRVIERGKSDCTVYYEGAVIHLPSCLVKLDSDGEYKAWTAYAARFAPAHSTHLLNDKTPLTLVTNSQITILDDLGVCYVISVNGQYRFLALDQVNKSPVNYNAGYVEPESSGSAPTPDTPVTPETPDTPVTPDVPDTPVVPDPPPSGDDSGEIWTDPVL